MIERYTREKMGKIWRPESKYQKWLDVEISVCEALAELGEIPKDSLERIKERAQFSVPRIEAIEKEVKHDVIAFITCVAESVGDDARYIHLGLTSSDILDTSMAMLLKEASGIIVDDIKGLLQVLKEKAYAYKDTVMVGRSHGVHAEPITFGLKLAVWYEEMKRNLRRMEEAEENIGYGKISGAVGTFSHISPEVEAYVCKKLELKAAPISTQIIQRDRYAQYFSTLAIIASSVEKMAVEIRHLQKTEVLETEEFFAKRQKGSSAMPHKRNPILSENLSGLARLVRSYSLAALENIPLWHERDISHSSVERVIAPDATILVDFMLNRFIMLVKQLIVYPEHMMNNLNKTKGLIFSERVFLELVRKGLSRDEAYALVQRNAMNAWEGKEGLKNLLLNDPDVSIHLSSQEIDRCFDLKHHLRYVDYIFERVFST
jgi:adenylosuccinate lyase